MPSLNNSMTRKRLNVVGWWLRPYRTVPSCWNVCLITLQYSSYSLTSYSLQKPKHCCWPYVLSILLLITISSYSLAPYNLSLRGEILIHRLPVWAHTFDSFIPAERTESTSVHSMSISSNSQAHLIGLCSFLQYIGSTIVSLHLKSYLTNAISQK